MIRSSATCVFPALLIWLSGCSEVFRPTYDYSQVEVTAVDSNGDPVADVRLTLYTGEAHFGYGFTNTEGHFEFGFVPRGTYGVEAFAPEGYAFPAGAVPYTYVTVGKGEVATVDFLFDNVDSGPISVTRASR